MNDIETKQLIEFHELNPDIYSMLIRRIREKRWKPVLRIAGSMESLEASRYIKHNG